MTGEQGSTHGGSAPTALGGGRLGTFAGVFTPSVLTILGIILFLRMGFVVGNAGVGQALLIVALANAISVLTSISLAAIATNLHVRGGGDYYLISRTLGVEFGGAIGLVLFLAQSVSIAFYCIGFGEAVAGLAAASSPFATQWIGAAAVSFLLGLAWLGADWATRFQYLVMAALVAALASFFLGAAARWDTAMLAANWSAPAESLGFWAVFAIFFPAVTGFTQGVSMSGDLRDPGRSLPLGTFLAVGISIVVYFGATLAFGASLPAARLASDYAAMRDIALVGFLVNIGVIAATLSSAMASFLGAPRILQSTARDRIFPLLGVFAAGSGAADNPRRAVLFSAAIAYATIALGNLNLVARVVSMFFLISYGLLNYATYYEARARSPSFRPRFRWFSARLSLVGGGLCLVSMLALDLAAGVVALALLSALYQYLKRTAGPARWAAGRRSYHLQQVREHLFGAAAEPGHPRDWRPQMLAFSSDPERRRRLLRVAQWLEGGSGMTTAVTVVEGRGLRGLRRRDEVERELRAELSRLGASAFPLALVAPNLEVGVSTLVQAAGIGPLRANTVLLNWIEERATTDGPGPMRYGRNLRATYRLGLNLVILESDEAGWQRLMETPEDARRIDVWWQDDPTGSLMLLLAYLVTRDPGWGGARLRALTATGESAEQAGTALQGFLEEARIDAAAAPVDKVDAAGVVAESGEASLVFLPLRLLGDRPVGPFGIPLEEFLDGLPTTVLVLAAEDIDLDATPEEGLAGDIAAASDALEEARRRASSTDTRATELAQEAEGRLREFREVVLAGGQIADLDAAEEAARKAQEEARTATRKAAKAAAKLEQAEQDLTALGVALPDHEPEDAGEPAGTDPHTP